MKKELVCSNADVKVAGPKSNADEIEKISIMNRTLVNREILIPSTSLLMILWVDTKRIGIVNINDPIPIQKIKPRTEKVCKEYSINIILKAKRNEAKKIKKKV